MRDTGKTSFGRLSDDFAGIVHKVAPWIGSARARDGRLSGFLWSPTVFLTAPHAEEEADIVLAGNPMRGSHPLAVPDDAGFAAFQLATPRRGARPLRHAEVSADVGSLVLIVGLAADAVPTAWLMMVSRAGADGVHLDRPLDPASEGGPVLDGNGRFLGMAVVGPDGPILLENAAIARALAAPRSGWIGVAFQPTLVPVALRDEAGQDSGRRVMRIARGGPAERAGLVTGDIVLSLDGVGMTGAGSLRGFLARTPPGRAIIARLVRNGRIETRALVVQADPNAA